MNIFDGIFIVSLLVLYWAVWAAFRTIEIQGASIELLLEELTRVQKQVHDLNCTIAQHKESK